MVDSNLFIPEWKELEKELSETLVYQNLEYESCLQLFIIAFAFALAFGAGCPDVGREMYSCSGKNLTRADPGPIENSIFSIFD